MRRLHDWRAVQEYHDAGHGFVECRRHFGFTHTAWIKAIKRGELKTKPSLFPDRRRRYDWAEVQAYYDLGHSYRQCQMEFGFCAAAWEKARQRGEIRSRPLGTPVEILLRTSRSRLSIKRKLLKLGLLENRCDTCGISEWLGAPLSCHIDHVNGVKDDHRLENLRMLCPNCHSQTDTYGGKNARRRRSLQERGQSV
jgi:5-methylcytosine-specific restriction endonuclease McrA